MYKVNINLLCYFNVFVISCSVQSCLVFVVLYVYLGFMVD